MLNSRLVLVIGLILVSCLKLSEQTSNNDKLSEYQGTMNWSDAKSKCTSLKMRLPTRLEFKELYANDMTKGWDKDGLRYWSIEELTADDAFTFSVTEGKFYFPLKIFHNHVRCIR